MRKVAFVMWLFVCVCYSSSPLFAATEGDIDRGTFKLHYRLMGSGDPLLVLSGGPGIDADYMLPVITELSKSHQCIVLDQRGTGRSSLKTVNASTVTLIECVSDVEALRIALKCDRMSVMGHSWGGMLGMAYASVYPNRVDRLVLADSGGMTLDFYEYFGDNIIARLTTSDQDQIFRWSDPKIVEADPKRAEYERLIARSPGYFYDRERASYMKDNTKPENIHGDIAVLLLADLHKRHFDLRPALTHFQRPVLIIQGRQDPIGDGTAYETHAILKNSRLVFLNQCGHFPWLEQPQPFFKAVGAFLSKTQ